MSLVLALAVIAAYAPVLGHEFISIDDDVYVTENPAVQNGLTSRGVFWAFSTAHSGNWHPLTWLSLMLDAELHGLNATGFHSTNLLFHVLNVLLLFHLLLRMTGKLGASALAAALFGLHPLHVESVAWVSERKDVLSTFFWLLTTTAYLSHVRCPSRSKRDLVIALFVLGLMAKSMLVTLPFVFLLLDYWPLGRFSPGQRVTGDSDPSGGARQGESMRCARRLFREKTPLLVVASLFCLIAYAAQQRAGAIGTLEHYPLAARVGNAITSYTAYLEKTFWPTDLAFFYPYEPSTLLRWPVVLAAIFLLAASLLTYALRRRSPHLLVGWFWYLGTLLPVIGLVQIGEQRMADRYTYVPLIGIFLMAAWALDSILRRITQRPETALLALTLPALVGLGILTAEQSMTWADDTTLSRHALRVTPNNFKAHHNLAIALERSDNLAQAVVHHQIGVSLKPGPAGHTNLGNLYQKMGDRERAVIELQRALELDPGFPDAHSSLGTIRFEQDDLDMAIHHYVQALASDPNSYAAHYNLASAYQKQGKRQRATRHYLEALRVSPESEPGLKHAHSNLGALYFNQGDPDNAIHHYLKALSADPDFAVAHYNLAAAYRSRGDWERAIHHFSEAVRIRPGFARARESLERARQRRAR